MISFRNLRINLLRNNSGVFAGQNIQYHWTSMRSTESAFGSINGEMNTLECSFSMRQSPDVERTLGEFCKKASDSDSEGGESE